MKIRNLRKNRQEYAGRVVVVYSSYKNLMSYDPYTYKPLPKKSKHRITVKIGHGNEWR